MESSIGPLLLPATTGFVPTDPSAPRPRTTSSSYVGPTCPSTVLGGALGAHLVHGARTARAVQTQCNYLGVWPY